MTLMHSKPDVPPESSTSPQSSKADKKEKAPEAEPAAVAVEAEKKEVAEEGVSHNLISFETPEAEFVYFCYRKLICGIKPKFLQNQFVLLY